MRTDESALRNGPYLGGDEHTEISVQRFRSVLISGTRRGINRANAIREGPAKNNVEATYRQNRVSRPSFRQRAHLALVPLRLALIQVLHKGGSGKTLEPTDPNYNKWRSLDGKAEKKDPATFANHNALNYGGALKRDFVQHLSAGERGMEIHRSIYQQRNEKEKRSEKQAKTAKEEAEAEASAAIELDKAEMLALGPVVD